jgi:serine/threonine-protein phosphatase 5
MVIKNIELKRQEANDLFKKQKIAEALAMYESLLISATSILETGGRDVALEEQMSLLSYNIAVVRYKQRRYRKALESAQMSLRYSKSDRVLSKMCATYLKLGMLYEMRSLYSKMESKIISNELSSMIRRLRGDAGAVTLGNLRAISAAVAEEKVIPAGTVERILRDGESALINCDNIAHVESMDEVLIFGDTHGQYFDLVAVINAVFDSTRILVFNGDFVDRGPHSVENFIVLLGLKIVFPTRVFLNRGNHEFPEINKVYGLEDEIRRKYPFNGDAILDGFRGVFRALSLCTVINGSVFVTHGGVPSKSCTIEQIQELYRISDVHTDPTLTELLWSDPADIAGIGESRRGAGVLFGPDITERFLGANGLDLVVRSHEYVNGGFRANHGGRVVTIFSAPDYEGIGSMAAYLVINPRDNGPEDAVVSARVRYRICRFNKAPRREMLSIKE